MINMYMTHLCHVSLVFLLCWSLLQEIPEYLMPYWENVCNSHVINIKTVMQNLRSERELIIHHLYSIRWESSACVCDVRPVCVRITLCVCLYASGRTSGSTYRSRIWSRSLLARGSVIITAFLTTSERTRRPKENSIKDWMWDNLLHWEKNMFFSILSSFPGQISKHSKIKIRSKF